MAYAIAIVVFLVLPAMAVAARITTHQRHGAHGRPDLESGHTGDLSSAASAAYNNMLRQARAEARIAAHQRYRAHGRPDLGSGRTGDLSSAASAAYNNLLRQARAEASGTRTRRERPATLRPVFHIGATPVPARVSPRASDQAIRREFDPDSSDGHGRAA